MFKKGLTLLVLLLLLPMSAQAAELNSAGVYCFQSTDFAGAEDPLTGICLTGVPERGAMRLGERQLRPGDVLTRAQLEMLTFAPEDPEQDVQVTVRYLPIYTSSVAKETSLSLALRGREDQPPVAEDSAMETYKNLANTGKLKVIDPEGQPMTFTLVRQPKRGTVELGADGSFTYTPKHNKVGVDSFTYTATDPTGKTSREATVTITILKPVDAASYTDTAGQDCCFAAEWMRSTGIFSGEALAGNACFRPEKTVTRGEFLSMLVKTLDLPVEQDVTYTGYADDVPRWLRPYLAAAVRSGLTSALPARQEFGAEEALTGAEATAMVCAALDLELADAMAEDAFALEAESTVTRAQTAMLLYQTHQHMLQRETKAY